MKALMCKQSLPAQSNWLACSKICFLVKVPSVRPQGGLKVSVFMQCGTQQYLWLCGGDSC